MTDIVQKTAKSDELIGIAPEIRDRICKFLAEYPVKPGAIAGNWVSYQRANKLTVTNSRLEIDCM